jgi:hypothetical protein
MWSCEAATNACFILLVWFCGCRQLLTAYSKSGVYEMKRVLMFIAIALATMAMTATVFAACGCGGKGGGKLKPETKHGRLIAS